MTRPLGLGIQGPAPRPNEIELFLPGIGPARTSPLWQSMATIGEAVPWSM